MPAGGDQAPEAVRAISMPDPPVTVPWKPARNAVKMARPWARAMTLDGIVRRTRGFLVLAGLGEDAEFASTGVGVGEGGGAGASA